jgi:hypothetical protein
MSEIHPVFGKSPEKILEVLQAPTPPDDIKFLPKSVFVTNETRGEGTALAIPHIDARFTQSRLDEACGPFEWQSEARECAGYLCVGIGIRNPETGEWLWKWDSGDEGKGDGKFGAKDKISGGLKRTGYLWGVGRDVYDYPTRRLRCKLKKEKGDWKFRGWIDNPLVAKRGFDDPPPTQEKELPEGTHAGNGEPTPDPEPEEVTVQQARRFVFDFAVTQIEMTSREANDWINDQERTEGTTVEAYRAIYSKLVAKNKANQPPDDKVATE